MNAGIVGIFLAFMGVVIGVFGGAAGTYFAITGAHSEAERQLMKRTAVVMWLAVISVAIAVALLPPPYPALLLIAYGISLPVGISYVKSWRDKIREQHGESTTL